MWSFRLAFRARSYQQGRLGGPPPTYVWKVLAAMSSLRLCLFAIWLFFGGHPCLQGEDRKISPPGLLGPQGESFVSLHEKGIMAFEQA